MLNIIIPTLNAEKSIAQTLEAVFACHLPDLNVVVVDGGSTDATQLAAKNGGAKVIECSPGRGRQLAFGADNTSGQWLLFLHADTVLPSDWEDHVRRYIAVALNVQKAAYFQLRFDDRSAGAKRVAMLANWRAKAWGLPYGDQGLLIHRTLYDEVGGYHGDMQLMEDVNFVQRLGPMRVEALHAYVTTSAAKYHAGGWIMRPLRNMTCLGLYFIGAPNRWIESLYK